MTEPVGQSPLEALPRYHHGTDGMDEAEDGVWIERALALAATVRPPGDEVGLRAAASEWRDAWAAFDEAVMAVPLLGDEFDRNSPEYLALKAAVSRRLEADDALRAALAAKPDQEEPGLDVERLATAMANTPHSSSFADQVSGARLVWHMLNERAKGHTRSEAGAIAAEYARLANPDTGS